MSDIWVLKEDGQKERFSPEKVRRALQRSGLSSREADIALKQLRPKLYDGMTTKSIYKLVYQLLEEMKPEVSHKYNLKRALQHLGPAGYEFEDFIAQLLKFEGYDTELRQSIEGRCVVHEIDVVARKDKEEYMVECKFKNQPGYKCRIQTALYVYARFLDLKGNGSNKKFTKPWLITNAKFSNDVIAYAECMGIPLTGWRHPFRYSLEAMIDKSRCYPVSVIKMGDRTLRQLLRKKIVTVFDLPESPQKLSDITGISVRKARDIIRKAEHTR